MEFEKSLMECEEVCNALEVLIKPEILDTFLSMIAEYRLNYTREIDGLVSEIKDYEKMVDTLEHKILDLKGDVKQLQKDNK